MRRLYALIAATAAFAPLAAAGQATAPTPPGRDVVVTGRRLSDTDAALKACIARHCPPDEDIRATLAHAENEFVAGDYKAARNVLQDSVGRNKRFAKQYPVPVSDLLRADGRVAVHLGEGDHYRISTVASLDALKAGLPDGDPRVLAQRIEVGDAPVRNSLTRLAVGGFDGQWVDVSFWIKPDGHVDDVGVLRESKPTVKDWDKPVLDAIRSRRYAPLTIPADDPGMLRVERYTYTSFFDPTATGTRIAVRDGQPRVEMLDLSDEPAGTPAGGKPTSTG